MDTCLVTGAGGFIGGHLVKRCLEIYDVVHATDIKKLSEWWQVHELAVNYPVYDLSKYDACEVLFKTAKPQKVFNLAANMGGIGFIETHKSECMQSVVINANCIKIAKNTGVKRYLFTSSACVYSQQYQQPGKVIKLDENRIYPLNPESGYGEEKLFSEWMCQHYHRDYEMDVYMPRLHNVYGPHGTWRGGREKAPAALCRKIIESDGTIRVVGDGSQMRSYMWIEDCIKGLIMLIDSDIHIPINLGSEEVISIKDLVSMISSFENKSLISVGDLSAPQGVASRCSDNEMWRFYFDWEPSTELKIGLRKTYEWIKHSCHANGLAVLHKNNTKSSDG